jgi:hypothetical protein
MREYQQNQPRADRPDIDRPVFHSFFHSCGKPWLENLNLSVAVM